MTDQQNNFDSQGARTSADDTAPQPTRSRKDKKPKRNRSQLDRILTIVLAIMIALVVGFGGFFVYRVIQDRNIALNSDTQYRIISQLKKEIKDSPDNPALRVRLGEAYMSSGDYKEAIAQFKTAIELSEGHVGAYSNMGMAFLYLKQPKDAEIAFNKVLELTEESQYKDANMSREAAFYALGRIYLDAKDYEKAAGYFKEALRIKATASDTYVALAQCLIGMSETDAAIDQLQLGIQFDPANAEVNYLLGQCYTKKKDKVNAVYYYANAAKAAPDQKEVKAALATYDKPEVYVETAKTELSEGKLDAARDSVIIATNLDTANLETMKLHIEIADKLKKYDECLTVAKTAVDTEGGNTDEFTALVKKYEKLTPKKKENKK